jgi:hypothetical protein
MHFCVISLVDFIKKKRKEKRVEVEGLETPPSRKAKRSSPRERKKSERI